MRAELRRRGVLLIVLDASAAEAFTRCPGEWETVTALRFTLTWSVNGDMDLRVLPPCGTEIFYGRTAACGGQLDRDDVSARGPESRPRPLIR